jgi:hypothetical protein
MQIFVRSFQGPLGQTHTHNRPEKQKAWPGVGPAGVRCAACGLRTGHGAAMGAAEPAPRIRTKSACAATRLTCRLNENYSFLEDQHDHGSATRNGKAKAIGRSPPRFM